MPRLTERIWNTRLPLVGRLHDYKFRLLLVSLFILAVVYPMLQPLVVGRLFLDVLMGLLLVVAVLVISWRPRQFYVAMLLAIPAVATTWIDDVYWYIYGDVPALLVALNHSTDFLFYVMFTSLIVADVFRGTRVSTDKICGAVCGYMLMGLVFGIVYSGLGRLNAEAFEYLDSRQGEELLESPDEVMSRCMYFSFVTLSTLGYGDMTPATPYTRTLAWLEAVIGQMYLTVLIARLVGLHISQSDDPEPSD